MIQRISKRFIFIGLVIVGLSFRGFARAPVPAGPLNLPPVEIMQDTIPSRQKPEVDQPAEGKRPEIKEVPKSRRQLKPAAVGGGGVVKVKPVKVPKPKIVKPKVGPRLKVIR